MRPVVDFPGLRYESSPFGVKTISQMTQAGLDIPFRTVSAFAVMRRAFSSEDARPQGESSSDTRLWTGHGLVMARIWQNGESFLINSGIKTVEHCPPIQIESGERLKVKGTSFTEDYWRRSGSEAISYRNL